MVLNSRLILAPALWRFDRETFRRSIGRTRSAAPLLSQIQPELPRYIYLAQGDALLLLDSHSPFAVDLLRSAFAKEPSVTLVESLLDEYEPLAKSDQGSHVHELLIPLEIKATGSTSKSARAAPTRRPVSPLQQPSERKDALLPGDECWYAKVYCSQELQDRHVLAVALPKIRQLQEERLISRWFYVRYKDPDHHLRFRLFPTEMSSLSTVHLEMTGLFRTLRDEGSVGRLQLDTYERELIRYGGHDLMPFAEEVFHFDSECCASLLVDHGYAFRPLNDKLIMAVTLLWTLAEALNISEEALAEGAGVFLGDRAGEWGESSRKLEKRMRQLVRELTLRVLAGSHMSVSQLVKSSLAPIELRNRHIRIAVGTFCNQLIEGQAPTPLLELFPSLSHMCMNRLFSGDSNTAERVAIALLRSVLHASTARAKS